MIRISRLSLAATLAALVLSACTTYDGSEYVGESTYQLAEFSKPDGPTEIYELRVLSDGLGYLNVIREGPKDFQMIGLRLTEMDKDRAAKRNMRPFSGLLVRSVERDSPAEDAGLRVNDILLAMDGVDLFLLKDFDEMKSRLVPDQSVEFSVRTASDPQPREVVVETVTKTRRSRELSRVALESAKTTNPKPYAGIIVRAVPKEYSRRIYGDDRNAIVISGVGLGSPAYLAGLRAGDIIERIDGKPAPNLAGVLKLLRTRGARGENLAFEVTRDDDNVFETEVELEDYTGTTRASFPFVFSASSSARSTSWKALPIGALARYSNSYTSSKTRESEQYGSYSMLLGLIRYSWSPSGGRTRLLWFISWLANLRVRHEPPGSP